jgi:hypothetical protein
MFVGSSLCSPGSRATSRTSWSTTQLVLSKDVELLIWQRHQGRQRVHLGGCISVRFSTSTTDKSKTMGVSQALKTGYHTTIHFN